MGRSKQRITKAVQVQLAMLKFAQRLTELASVVEKLCYVFMLRDPYLSFAAGMSLAGFVLCGNISLWLVTLIFGQYGIPLIVWAGGFVVLLPEQARANVLSSAWKLREWKIGKF